MVTGHSTVVQKRCANCERELGKLERLFPWEGNEVCLACYEHLKMEADATLRDRQIADVSQANDEQQRLARESSETALAKLKKSTQFRLVAWSVLALAGFITISQVIGAEGYSEVRPWFAFGALAAIVVGGVGALLANVVRQNRKCPKCKKSWAALLLGAQDLGSHEHVSTRTENIKVREGIGSGGRVLANYNVPVQERFLQTEWSEFYQCGFCGHEWTVRKRASRKTA
jgi:hypothetical protein